MESKIKIKKGQIEDYAVQLTGTETDKPIKGDLEISSENKIFTQSGFNESGIRYFNDEVNTAARLYAKNTSDELTEIEISNSDGIYVQDNRPESKGIVANTLFDKQNDPNAFAQLGDVEHLATTSYVNLACIPRWDGTNWVFVDDGVHSPIYASSIENLETSGGFSFNFKINYPEVDRIGSFVCSLDEGYAKLGLFAGASVNATSASVRVCKQGMSIKFRRTSGVWTMVTDANAIVMPSQFSASFNGANGVLTISHPDLFFQFADEIILAPYLGSLYTPEFFDRTSTSFSLRFRNITTNAIELVANDSMHFIIQRTGVFRVPNTNMTAISTGCNFWVQGIFHKKGISGNIPFDYPIDSNPTDNSESLVMSGGVFEYGKTKADLDSPTFTGNVVVPTADAPDEAVPLGQVEDLLSSQGIQEVLNNGSSANIITPFSIQSDNGGVVKGAISLGSQGVTIAGQAGGVYLNGDTEGVFVNGGGFTANVPSIFNSPITSNSILLIGNNANTFAGITSTDEGGIQIFNTNDALSGIDFYTSHYVKINDKNIVTEINGIKANDVGEISLTQTVLSPSITLDLTCDKNVNYFANTGGATTWTLPPVSGNTGKQIIIINKGSGNISLNTDAGNLELFDGAPLNAMPLIPGATYGLYCDGDHWTALY